MRFELLYDTGASRGVRISDVILKINDMISTPVTLRDMKDAYGIYQVDGRINPQVFTSLYAKGGASAPLRLILTGYDLKPPSLHFSFGATWAGVVSIVSTHRMEGSALLTGVTSLHELFHQVGLVDPSQPQYNRQSGMEGHCVNRCLMRPANSMAELRTVARDWDGGIRLCHLCTPR